MAYTGQVSVRQRMAAGSGAVLAVAAIGLGFAAGLDLDVVRKVSETITAIALPAPEPPRIEPVPQKVADQRQSGEASAANRHAKAAAIVAPKPVIPPPVPPPIATATKSGIGSDASAGAAPNPGPGSGAGGQGDGTGTGGAGSGTGGGTRPVWRSGTIRDRDYPKSASRAKTGGEVETRFTILPTGRVTGCRVTRSSGDASLDATTCRLIEDRFRFKPAPTAPAIRSPACMAGGKAGGSKGDAKLAFPYVNVSLRLATRKLRQYRERLSISIDSENDSQ